MFQKLKNIFASKSTREKSESLYTSLAQSEGSSFWKKITGLLVSSSKVDEGVLEEIEEILLSADVSFETTTHILKNFDHLYKQKVDDIKSSLDKSLEIRKILFESTLLLFQHNSEVTDKQNSFTKPHVIVIVGVNGVGKTTTIAKLAYLIKKTGASVVLGAGDTFRSGAIEQLEMWAHRLDCPIVKKDRNSDPSSVVFDTIKSAMNKNVDVAILDTSGRLHNNSNLMGELKKMTQTAQKLLPNAPHEILLVIDGTFGQNAIEQAKKFKEMVNVSGIIVTKLDGTSKGGVLLSIADTLEIPIKYIGVGEQPEDLILFDFEKYLEKLFFN